MASGNYGKYILVLILVIAVLYILPFRNLFTSVRSQAFLANKNRLFTQGRVGLDVNISDSSCLYKDVKENRLLSCFVDENLEDKECLLKRVQLAKVKLPKVALASFPGSGNTWTRHLIEQISGIATGSVYCDKVLKVLFIGECHTSGTIAIKTHRGVQSGTKEYDKAILIVRNPFDALVAEFNRRGSKNHNQTGVAELSAFETDRKLYEMRLDWKSFIRQQSKRWRTMIESWTTKFMGPVHVVFYENLINNLYDELIKLSKFLHMNTTLHDIWCAGKNQEGHFHRTKSFTAASLYTKELRAIIQSHIQNLSDSLKDNLPTKAIGILIDKLYLNKQ